MALGGIIGAVGGGTLGRATVEIVGDSSKLRTELEKSKATTAATTKTMGTSTTGFAKYAQGAYLLAGAAVVGFVAAGVRAASALEKVNAQTAAGIESTGGAANVTAEHVRDLAARLEELSSVDEIAIQQGQNLLLTFTNIRNEVGAGNAIFDRATTAALDLSVRGFGSMESTSKMLGKALQDPIRGLTALGRAGVQFTAQQKEQIKTLVESGKVLEAQRIILKEVEKQVGGSAAALGKTTAGQWALFKDAVEDTARTVATELMPALAGLAGGLANVIQFLGPLLGILGDLIGAVAGVPGGFATLLGVLLGYKALTFLPTLLVATGAAFQKFTILTSLGSVVGNFGVALSGLIPILGSVGLGIGALLLAGEGLQGLVNRLTNTVSTEQALLTVTTQLQQAVASGKFTWDEIQGAVDRYNETIGSLPGAERLTMDAIRGTGTAATGTAGSVKDLATAQDTAADTARDLLAAELALAGGFVGVSGSVLAAAEAERSLQTAQAEVNRLTKEGKTGTDEYTTALAARDSAAQRAIDSQFTLAGAVQKYAGEIAAGKSTEAEAIARVRDYGVKAGLTGGQIQDLIGRVKSAVREYGNIPKAVQTNVTLNNSAAMQRLRELQDRYRAIKSEIEGTINIAVNPPKAVSPGGQIGPVALGGIIAGAAGFITRGPTMLVGESRKMTFAGKGAEAVIPFDNRGIGILAKALEKAGSGGSGEAVTNLYLNVQVEHAYGDNLEQIVVGALGRAASRYGGV